MAAYQVSSSSSSFSSNEVFLSFHGKDVRTSFADYLYHDLIGTGIRTFRDDEELSKGKEIAPELLAAIHDPPKIQQKIIVFDDVDQDIQVKSLAGDREWFGIGSKIIIISRNKDILIAPKTYAIYEPEVMTPDDSLKLFSHYAFGRDQPLEDYLDLSKIIVNTTGGLPLALQIIGSSLFKKAKSVWTGMLKKLKKVAKNDVMKCLKISYDGLKYAKQQIFLDTAWISESSKLEMHDVLRDLGRDIVRQESIKKAGKRSRLWFQEEVLDVSDKQTGTSKREGLTIDFSSRSRIECSMNEGIAKMTELRLLLVDYAQSIGNFTNSFSELRWLSWRGCPNQYALTNFCPKKLTVLDLSNSKITAHWMAWNCIKMAVNLEVLSLSSCYQLSSTPDVSENRLLEVLIIKDSEKLVQLDTSVCYLRNVVTLAMNGCKRN
ncbi:disease resistance protein L6-like [Macadamia integrifolia]|uniref:disease resistance protein L6-like n=1 Tax=Macadamia integrifolia TaxID=60698 RepID=UPI001C527481|nr:disease resistance protein L6-like [Macadamia integrifolia]